MKVAVPDNWMATIRKLGAERHKLHQGHDTSRPFSEDYEVVGLAGEYAFGSVFALMPDWEVRPGGDNGIDFNVGAGTLDVKTARKPFNLIVEVGTTPADILVLAGWDDETTTVELIGWETRTQILMAPRKDFGYGIVNHYIEAASLRKMAVLYDHVEKWRRASWASS